MTKLFAALLATTLAASAAHAAGENAAESCLRTKVWEGYEDGWGIRTMTSTALEEGKTRNYLVTLYQGNKYRIATCGDKHVKNLDVLLYDTKGNIITKDHTEDREPVLEFEPAETATYYVVLYLRGLEARKVAGEVAMAVVYK